MLDGVVNVLLLADEMRLRRDLHQAVVQGVLHRLIIGGHQIVEASAFGFGIGMGAVGIQNDPAALAHRVHNLL